MTRVVLIGTGNVARHLFDAFHKENSIRLIQVVGRNSEALSYFSDRVATTTDFGELEEADIYILAVSDMAIGELSGQLTYLKGLLVHTSGSTPMDILPNDIRRGVFYPLQTFSKEIEVDFKTIPICLEAESEEDYVSLAQLAGAISESIYSVDSQQRLQLHIAAVFVNNFVNHLYSIGENICRDQQFSLDILKPLIKETVRKIETISPYDAQTGPARRGDFDTVNYQIEHLKSPTQKEIYKVISKSIEASYGEKL